MCICLVVVAAKSHAWLHILADLVFFMVPFVYLLICGSCWKPCTSESSLDIVTDDPHEGRPVTTKNVDTIASAEEITQEKWRLMSVEGLGIVGVSHDKCHASVKCQFFTTVQTGTSWSTTNLRTDQTRTAFSWDIMKHNKSDNRSDTYGFQLPSPINKWACTNKTSSMINSTSPTFTISVKKHRCGLFW